MISCLVNWVGLSSTAEEQPEGDSSERGGGEKDPSLARNSLGDHAQHHSSLQTPTASNFQPPFVNWRWPLRDFSLWDSGWEPRKREVYSQACQKFRPGEEASSSPWAIHKALMKVPTWSSPSITHMPDRSLWRGWILGRDSLQGGDTKSLALPGESSIQGQLWG